MKSITKRIRRDYAPLTVSVSLVCSSPGAALTQVYNAETGTYDPDHGQTNLIVHPLVSANAQDGSWQQTNVNSLLANMKWYVNGADISTLSEWAGLYTIDTSTGATRGDILIKKNLTAGERVELSFRAEFADPRQGVNVPVYADPVIMACADKSNDGYELTLGDTQVLQYNPFKDPLHRYEYKVSHGLLAASSTDEAAARANVNAYERTIPVRLHRGGVEMDYADYLVQLTEVPTGTAPMPNIFVGQNGFREVTAIEPSGITLDLRMVEKRDYLVVAYIAGAYQVGDNLFKQSKFEKIDKWGGVTSSMVIDSGYNGQKAISRDSTYYAYQWVKLENGKQYTLSFYAKGSGTIECIQYVDSTNNSIIGTYAISNTSSWDRVTMTFTPAYGDGSYAVGYFRFSSGSGYISCPKLEEGTTATAWSLHRSEILDKKAAQIQFSVCRIYPKFNVRPTNGTSITAEDTDRYDQVMAEAEGHILDVPESVLRILWYTDSATKTAICHGEGATVHFNLNTTGIGSTASDDWLDVYTESEHKPVFSLAADESNNTLTDENGNELIFN